MARVGGRRNAKNDSQALVGRLTAFGIFAFDLSDFRSNRKG